MTSQSGGGSGYPGVTSDGANGLIVQNVLTAGDAAASPIETDHNLYGSVALHDAPGNNISQDAILLLDQVQDVPSGQPGASAAFIRRHGDISAQDYTVPEVVIVDSTASTQPTFQITKSGTVVLEVTTRKSITGALASVTDANAKAVLTSIIAALTGIKIASDNTT